jgi:hypothetical protein
VNTYPDWRIPEFVQPMSNSIPSCAWCEGYEAHHAYCGRAAFVAEYKRLVGIVDEVTRLCDDAEGDHHQHLDGPKCVPAVSVAELRRAVGHPEAVAA